MNDLETYYKTIVIAEHPYFEDYSYSFSFKQFYKLCELKFEFENGMTFTFNIEDNSIVLVKLKISSSANFKEIVKFSDRNFKRTSLKNAIQIINIFEPTSIEIKYEKFKKPSETDTLSLVMLNESYKLFLSFNERSKESIQNGSENLNFGNVTVYSIKNNHHLVEDYFINEIIDLKSFLHNIKFKINKDIVSMLSRMIDSCELSNFEDLMDYYFEEINSVKNINSMLEY